MKNHVLKYFMYMKSSMTKTLKAIIAKVAESNKLP